MTLQQKDSRKTFQGSSLTEGETAAMRIGYCSVALTNGFILTLFTIIGYLIENMMLILLEQVCIHSIKAKVAVLQP